MGILCTIVYTLICVVRGMPSTWYQGVLALWGGIYVAYNEAGVDNCYRKHGGLLVVISMCLMYGMNLLTFNIIDIPLSGTLGAIGTPLFTALSMAYVTKSIPVKILETNNIIISFLSFVGNNSYYIYLLHGIIGRLLGITIKNTGIIYILTMVINCVIVQIVKLFLERGKKYKSAIGSWSKKR